SSRCVFAKQYGHKAAFRRTRSECLQAGTGFLTGLNVASRCAHECQGFVAHVYGSRPAGQAPTMPMNADGSLDMERQVEDLRGAEEPFDASFIEAMIPHHQMAVSAARLALQQATHPELSQLAAAILDAQQKEIGQMQAWRLQWYGSLRPNMNNPMPTS